MRRVLFFLHIIFVGWLTAVVGSCTSEAVDAGYTVNPNLLKVSDLNMLGTTTDTVLTIETNSAWTLRVTNGDEQQLGLSRNAGNGTTNVRITPGINPSATTSRSWTLQVTTEAELSRNITVTQGGADVSLLVLPEAINAPAEGDTVTVSITCNGNWTAELTGQAPSFVHFNNSLSTGSGNATLVLVIDKNNSTAERSGELKLTATDGQQHQQVVTIDISQEGMIYVLNVSVPDMSQLPSSSATLSATITSNSSWTATISGDNFVTLGEEETATASGFGNTILKMNVAENTSSSQRSAVLTVIMDLDQSKRFSADITQMAKTYTFVLHRKRVVMPNTGGTFSLGFTAENTWRAEAETGEWIQLSKYVGSSADESITVTVDANYTQNTRTDIITFTILEGGYQAQCEVMQAAQGAPVVARLTAVAGADGTAVLTAHYESDANNVGLATECGFYYGTDSNNLTDSGTMVSCDVGNGISSTFTCNLSGLQPNVTYYVQAFAVNPRGTGLSELKSMTTDGNVPGEVDIQTPDTPGNGN